MTRGTLAEALTRHGSRWTPLDRPTTRGGYYQWVRCSCGVEREVRKDGLTSGKSLSCGCLSREQASLNIRRASRPPLVPPATRFWAKVAGGDVASCWEWQGAKAGGGYGDFYLGVIDGRKVNISAHRWAYEHLRAPIPDGLFLDHLCRNKACVNPWHLEPVTNLENMRRGDLADTNRARAASQTHCKNGHKFTPENTYRDPKRGGRHCRACAREAWRAAHAPELLGLPPRRRRATDELAGIGLSTLLEGVTA